MQKRMMTYANKTGGISKEEVKNRRGTSRAMTIGPHHHSLVDNPI
jgi:hypothetical protein